MKRFYQTALTIFFLFYFLTPAIAEMGPKASVTAHDIYRPQESQANAQQFLKHVFEHIQEGTLGGDIPLQLSKEDIQTSFGIKVEDLTASTPNTSYFDRGGYRYFLMYLNKGKEQKEYLLVIGTQFEPLTKEQIFEIFGNAPYADSKMYHTIIYKQGEYSVMFSHTNPKNRAFYDTIMISPLSPKAG